LGVLASGKGLVYKEGKARAAEQSYLVTELAENGELFDFVLDVEGF
jgi:hypothetical protein